MLSDYARTLENEILPLLRKQKGFKDEITLSNPGRVDVIAISLWENKAFADAYNNNVYPELLKTVARMIDGAPKVQTFESVTSTFHQVAVAAQAGSSLAIRVGLVEEPPLLYCGGRKCAPSRTSGHRALALTDVANWRNEPLVARITGGISWNTFVSTTHQID